MSAKPKNKKKRRSAAVADERVAELQSNPVFREIPRGLKKVKLDSRFSGMLKDERFASTSARVDRRGRPVEAGGETELGGVYDVEDDAPVDVSPQTARPDLARGEGPEVSSSEDSSDSSESEAEETSTADRWGELDAEARRVDWSSARLAVCNLDWDRFRAEDVLMALESMKSGSGALKSVSVYLSDFGKQRLEQEDRVGPVLGNTDGLQEGEELPDDVIRGYQWDRFKYYYAVAECDSEATAEALYAACDGMEYESSGIRFDLRFIPAETTFEESRLRERATPEDVNPNKYRPKYFQSAAASRASVKMDWDTNDYNRQRAVQKAFEEGADLDDCEGLLASGSDDDEEQLRNARVLLDAAGIAPEAKTDSAKAALQPKSVKSKRDSASKTKEGVGKDEKADKTPFAEFLERRKQKRRERKAQLRERAQAARSAEDAQGAEPARKPRKKTKLAQQAEKLPADTADPRFEALFVNSEFAIDRTHSQFKGGIMAEKQVQEKRKRALR